MSYTASAGDASNSCTITAGQVQQFSNDWQLSATLATNATSGISNQLYGFNDLTNGLWQQVTFGGSSLTANDTITIPFNTGSAPQYIGSGVTDSTAWGNSVTAGEWIGPNIMPREWVGTGIPFYQPYQQAPPRPIIPEAAEVQAKELLKEIIGEEGAKILMNGGKIRIGGMYEIDHLGNCYKLLPEGGRKRFCIVPDRELPWGDVLVNKIVALIADPDMCERVANWSWPPESPAALGH